MQSINDSKRLKGIKGSCFEVSIEYNAQFIVIHLPTVDKMTKDVFLEMQWLIEDWFEFIKVTGYKYIYAVVDQNSKRIKKLLRMLDFKEIGKHEDLSVFRYGEEKWDQQHQ